MSRNAVIMAAGMSTRFVPLSMEIPKALLKVKGEVLIERQIRQLKDAGIEEIIIVVGYLKDQFEYLQEKYGVILIENTVYQKRNNHSTLYVVRDYLKNTFICSGDNYFTENVFLETSRNSYYASVYEEGDTDEWCIFTDKTGRIDHVEIGGRDSWTMKGHAYFTEEFSYKMIPYIVEAYNDENSKNKFWEEIYMEHIQELDMYIHKYEPNIIEEFDSIEELRKFDSTYIHHTRSKVLEKLCIQLECKESEISHIRPIKDQGKAVGFCFNCRTYEYKYFFKTRVLEMEEKENGK